MLEREKQWPVPAARSKSEAPAHKHGGVQDEDCTDSTAIQQQISDSKILLYLTSERLLLKILCVIANNSSMSHLVKFEI